MRIISYNLNGIRAAINKGFIDWLNSDPADIICIQETKAMKENVDITILEQAGFDSYWFSADKKGYSGVAVLTKIKPDKVFFGNGIMQSDAEGRVLRLDFGNITLVNAYFPSGTSGELRQTYKYQWLNEFMEYLETLRKERPNLVITGDYNIAHREIDIHDPVGNKKSSGFLPEERAWMDKFLSLGYIDSFRHLHPNSPARYSWWSQRFPTVRLQNKGWRIDYICVTQSLADAIVSAEIYPNVKHSDHCPVFIELNG
ncbi:MAG TPA: exodeoxyribonuclease III [Panacibacter sp.]|nr:exodeoxyribonuclease III [Panacibacter sp.]HNP44183.1 exodeoxyribonuclease III [Panacibacter sp.]